MAMEEPNLWSASTDANHLEPLMLLKLPRMSAFPKADVQNLRVGTDLDVRLWPKADIR